MSKKEKIMRRFAALLIVSLILTSSAITSLATGKKTVRTTGEKVASESTASPSEPEPTEPTEPSKPTEPSNPTDPSKPTDPVVPAEPDVPDIDEPEISDDEIEGVFENVEEARQSISEQTTQIREAVKEAVKDNLTTTEDTKKVFADIEGIPENSELKLLSVKPVVEVEKDADGKPVVDENGKPVVVVKTMTYDIVVSSEGKVIPHDKLKDNKKKISVDVPLPAQGIKKEWKYAAIKHYADKECKNLLETLYSAIKGETDRYVTITTTSFSPFVMEFSVENPEPATPGGNTSSGGSSGGGSRRHVVGGGSSANSYSMTGTWAADANGWTFTKSNGQKAVNTWGWINGRYYYFDAAGRMATGWQFINGKWYYLNPSTENVQGSMLTGVIFDPAYNAYFYSDASGAMVTGWYQVGANWYYFSPVNDGAHVTGQLLSGTYVDGYYLGADGAWVPAN